MKSKNPFAILLALVVLVGIIISIVAIFIVGPRDPDDETTPIASRSELPTPSTRTAPERPRAESTEPSTEAPEASTDEDPEPDTKNEIVDAEPAELEVVVDDAPSQGRQGGFAAGAGPGGGNFQAIQEAMENNPEIAALLQKAQSGNISQAEQARLRELMQEALADAGIEIPGGGQGGGFGTPPVQGIITYIFGSTITIQDLEDTEKTTDVQVGENANITVIDALEVSELATGTNVNGVVRRGDGGKIFIVSLDVAPQNTRGGFGFGGFGAAGGDNSVSAIQGTITEVSDDMIHVETTQGTLRLTANEDSVIVSTTSGTLGDLTEGMGAIAVGPLQEGTIQARTLIAGSQDFITQQSGGLRGAGRTGQGQ